MKEKDFIIKYNKLENYGDMPDMKYAHEGDAGMDLYAAIASPVTIEARGYALIPSGISLEIPLGYEGQVRSRSGLALKQGLFVLNSPGTVDAGYRGEIGVILANFSGTPATVNRGDRVAQIVFAEVTSIKLLEIEELSESERSANGFGSSG